MTQKKWLLIFCGRETHSEKKKKHWNSSKISSKKVTTTTANAGNRRGSCAANFFICFHFSSFFSLFLFISYFFHFFHFLLFSGAQNLFFCGVHHQNCFARRNRRYEFHAFCPSRSSATPASGLIIVSTLKYSHGVFLSHTGHCHKKRHRLFVWQ